MKTTLTLFISLGFFSLANSQTITFQNIYGGTNTDIGRSVVAVSNGYVIAGTTTNAATGKDIVVFKTDLIGNPAWSKTLGGSSDDVVYDMKKTIDGGFIIAGETKSFPTSGNDTSNAFLIKLDNSGNVLWSHQYGGNGRDAAYAVTETLDSGFVATGFTNSFGAENEDVLAFRTDKNGGVVWKESIGGTGSDFGRAVCATASGAAFLITGNTNGFSAPGNIVYFIRIAGNGTLNWSKTYDFFVPVGTYQRYGYDVTVNGNNEYLIAGKIGKGSFGDAQAFVMSTDSTGNSINWCYSYDQNSGECSAHSIQHTADGGYIVGGVMGNFYPSIIKIDSVGNRQWDNYYSTSTFAVQGFGYKSTEDANGQFISTGYTIVPPQTDTSIVLIKSDSAGGNYCNSFNSFFTGNTSDSVMLTAVLSSTVFGGIDNAITLTINNTAIPMGTYCSSGVEENKLQSVHFILAPNPLTNSSVLTTNENIPAETSLRIYDAFGKLVMEKIITTNQTEISRENFSSGLYFYVVSGKAGMMDKGKFLVE